MQMMKLVPVEISPVGVQTDIVVPVVLVVVKGPSRASYTSVATQPLKEVPALAPGGPILPPIGAKALMVYGVSCWQAVADILWKAWRLRLGTSERVLGIRWLLGESWRRYKLVSSIVIYFSSIVMFGSRYVRFRGQWHPVDRYEFDRPVSWSEAGEYGSLIDTG